MTFTISVWPNAKSVQAEQRKDIEIGSFKELADVFKNPVPVKDKVNQRIVTRQWQETRKRGSLTGAGPRLITLDFDSVNQAPKEVHEILKPLRVNHFIFTTWTHKTIETSQKKNNGRNCFKVMLEATSNSPEELLTLTKSLAAKTGEHEVKRSDDISSGIFLGGAHPDFIKDFEFYYYDEGQDPTWVKNYLIKTAPKESTPQEKILDEFESWDATVGQKFTQERLQTALSTIKYEPIGDMSGYALWCAVGYALHSAKDTASAEGLDLFDLWDKWCLNACGELGLYDREQNEAFWSKTDIPKDSRHLCTLGTLWHLEKLFKAKESSSEIRQSSWTFFDHFAEEEPEEVKFLIKDLLVEKSIGFLVGTGGVGKSSLCLEIAKAISCGGNFFDDEKFPTIQGTVAVINKEDSQNKVHNQIHNLVDLDLERLVRSKSAVAADFEEECGFIPSQEDVQSIKNRWTNVARPGWAQSNSRLTNNDGEDLTALGAVISSLKTLQKELKKTGKPDLSLVIIDPLNLWHGGDQNSQRDMSFIFSALQQVQRDLDVTVLIVHHMNKSNGFSGSHTIRDSGRFMWYLRPMMNGREESDTFIDFYVEKNNDAKANYTALQFIRTGKGLLDTHTVKKEGEKE